MKMMSIHSVCLHTSNIESLESCVVSRPVVCMLLLMFMCPVPVFVVYVGGY